MVQLLLLCFPSSSEEASLAFCTAHTAATGVAPRLGLNGKVVELFFHLRQGFISIHSGKNPLSFCNVLHTTSVGEADRVSHHRNFWNFLKPQKAKRWAGTDRLPVIFKFIMFKYNAYL